MQFLGIFGIGEPGAGFGEVDSETGEHPPAQSALSSG
jgi:hypothetical protein